MKTTPKFNNVVRKHDITSLGIAVILLSLLSLMITFNMTYPLNYNSANLGEEIFSSKTIRIGDRLYIVAVV